MSKGPEVDYQQIEKIDTSGIAHHVVKERENIQVEQRNSVHFAAGLEAMKKSAIHVLSMYLQNSVLPRDDG